MITQNRPLLSVGESQLFFNHLFVGPHEFGLGFNTQAPCVYGLQGENGKASAGGSAPARLEF